MHRVVAWLFVGVSLGLAPLALAATPQEWAAANYPQLLELYKDLHAHPELSFHEKETAAKVAAAWKKAGFEVTTGVGGHGVVAVLKNGAGRTLMLRTDLDALPVTEKTNLVYASQVRVEDASGDEVGVMHACGHDVHMTNLVGVAQYLASHRDAWSGTLVLIGQPAEERSAGAKAMLAEGLFTRFPKPDLAVALHVDSTLAAGTVAVRGGAVMANVDSVDITVRGRGGHGAHPEATIDPIVQAAELVLSLQTIVSREKKAIDPAVITVGAIQGGTKHNIIPSECHLQLTVRSYDDGVRARLLAGIERKAKAIAQAYGAPEPAIKVSEGTPALLNDEQLAGQTQSILERLIGKENVVPAEPSMGAEDFSRYGRAGVPIVMYRLGAIEARRLARFQELGLPPPALHSPEFYPDIEPTLKTGLVTMCGLALELLKK